MSKKSAPLLLLLLLLLLPVSSFLFMFLEARRLGSPVTDEELPIVSRKGNGGGGARGGGRGGGGARGGSGRGSSSSPLGKGIPVIAGSSSSSVKHNAAHPSHSLARASLFLTASVWAMFMTY
ncbi:hypothetical protein AXF42_Ash004676 [Apostasia shenzhenica]|uniref:Uncharacterized protein n=1 Tax=Apostasia shenzhenica TaxID=1088818 RepID=A0A2I0BHD8_9ASPA|nr:hypothetical protein AXF42_Ash004676 [Apostasia shenzhenica]